MKLLLSVYLLCFLLFGCQENSAPTVPSLPDLPPSPSPIKPEPPDRPEEVFDGLDELNAYRAKKNLPAFRRDDGLTQAAKAAALYRAKHLLAGHTANDFHFLPEGSHADAAGCGALPDSWGWGTCCMDDSGSKWAGAAWARGSDGQRYMHLFVRR